ncbi:MAG: YicC/YloC family endoribonuclease [Eubacteriales bacterium]|nr:YicC/YloC family endoribonuclease [Eubacteriales bacterium]
MNTINSMTGFGRCEMITEDYRILVEIKSVNHRYLDLSIKMPRRFNCFEIKLRQLLKQYLERGKTDVYISYEDYTDGSKKLKYNHDLAEEYMHYFKQMAEDFDIRNDVGCSVLSRCQDVLIMEESTEDDDRLWELLKPVVEKAASDFRLARSKEGENLRADLFTKLDKMSEYVEQIVNFSPSVVEAYRAKLTDKIKETLMDSGLTADEGRIVTEVTIYADKICTDEEMVRLTSHIDAMKNKLLAGGTCGRELDFIAQEMNREANTTLSKANSLKIADTAILLKTEIEKVREQVQNIE